MRSNPSDPIQILLVEDDPGDVVLAQRALSDVDGHNALTVVNDGIEAMQLLRREGEFTNAPRPDLILLDLNLPRKDGRQTMAEIKADENLRQIPIVVLSTSSSDFDVTKCYDLQASCYITKPVDLEHFTTAVRTMSAFWLSIVRYPHSPAVIPN